MEIEGHDLGFGQPRLYGVDTSCLVHRRHLISRHGWWKTHSEVGYAHDWELVKRWVDGGEKWAASRKPTLAYNWRTSGSRPYLEHHFGDRFTSAPTEPTGPD
jgi:hypothetical protein